jgi:diguanylate cyclase (GGDEF)-like protein
LARHLDDGLPLPPQSGGREEHASLAWRYALLAGVLGIGAPGGALAVRVLAGVHDVGTELRVHAFFYLYELIGSCLVFGIAGYLAGRRADRLRSGRDSYRVLAERDPLTSLANARTFLEHYRRSLEHAERFHEPLSLLVVDVDQLKEINDVLGHAFGTTALLRVAHVLTTCKRDTDLAARWGGDEFALLMPGADEEAARRQADAIVGTLGSEPVRADGKERVVSVTIGIATAIGRPPESLFERADRALYEGKRTGRGQVRSAGR